MKQLKDYEYFKNDNNFLYHGDCLEVLRSMPESTVDSLVSDPPYG